MAVAWLGKEEIAVGSDACFYSHNMEPKYVACYFQSESFQKQKRSYNTGTKVKRVSAKDLALPQEQKEERKKKSKMIHLKSYPILF